MEKSLNNIFLLINNTLSDLSFIDKHRLSNTAFIRNRSLNFSTLILYLLNFRKHSNQVELDQFFKAINHKKEASQWITKSAFFQSRKQLSHTAFIGLNQLVIDYAYQHFEQLKLWKGFRLCAIDGTSIRLPNTPSIKTCIEKRLSNAPIKLRLVRVDLPNEVEVLITNLMDTGLYEASLFKSLYHVRWGVEENYKRLKQ